MEPRQPLYRNLRQLLPRLQQRFVESHLEDEGLSWRMERGLLLAEPAQDLLGRVRGPQTWRLHYAPHSQAPGEQELMCMQTAEEGEQILAGLRREGGYGEEETLPLWLGLGVIRHGAECENWTAAVYLPVWLDHGELRWAQTPAVVNELLESLWRLRAADQAIETDCFASWKKLAEQDRLLAELPTMLDGIDGFRLDMETCLLGLSQAEAFERFAELSPGRWPEEEAPQQRVFEAGDTALRMVFSRRPAERTLATAILEGKHCECAAQCSGWTRAVADAAVMSAGLGRSTLILGSAEEGREWQQLLEQQGLGHLILVLNDPEVTPGAIAGTIAARWRRPRPDLEGAESTLIDWHRVMQRVEEYQRELHHPVGESGLTPADLVSEFLLGDPVLKPVPVDEALMLWTPATANQYSQLLQDFASVATRVGLVKSHPFAEAQVQVWNEEREQALAAALERALGALQQVRQRGEELHARLGGKLPGSVAEVRRLLEIGRLLQKASELGVNTGEHAQWEQSDALHELAEASARLSTLKQASGVVPLDTWRLQLIELQRTLQQGSKSLLRSFSAEQRNAQRNLQMMFPGAERLPIEEQIKRVEAALEQLDTMRAVEEISTRLGPVLQGIAQDRLGSTALLMTELQEAVSSGHLAEAALDERLGQNPELHGQLADLESALTTRDSAWVDLVNLLEWRNGREMFTRLEERTFAEEQGWLERRRPHVAQAADMAEYRRCRQSLAELGFESLATQVEDGDLRPEAVPEAGRRAYLTGLLQLALDRPALRSFSVEAQDRAWFESRRIERELGPAHAALLDAAAWENLPDLHGPALSSLESLQYSSRADLRRVIAMCWRRLSRIAPILVADPKELHNLFDPFEHFDRLVVLPSVRSAVDIAPAALRSRAILFAEEAREEFALLLRDSSDVKSLEPGVVVPSHSAGFARKLQHALELAGYPARVDDENAFLSVRDPLAEDHEIAQLAIDATGHTDHDAHRVWTLAWFLDTRAEMARLLDWLGTRRRSRSLDHRWARHTVPYRRTELSLAQDRKSLSDFTLPELIEAMERVVSVEAPIHLAEVARRIAEAALLARLGPRSLSQLETAFLQGTHDGRLSRKGNFLTGNAPLRIRDRRGLPEPQRRLEVVPREEIVLALEAVRGEYPELGAGEALRVALAWMGVAATPQAEEKLLASLLPQVPSYSGALA